MSSTILSTKRLSASQRELALNGKLNIVEYDAIKIQYIPFEIAFEFDCFIFTSQNAVKSYLKNPKSLFVEQKKPKKLKALCVGEKTKRLLEENDFEVLATKENAESLGEVILSKYKKYSFLFLSGNLRRASIPELLKNNNIRYKEIVVYNTTLNLKTFKNKFDGILFFSPSGIESFTQFNNLSKSTAFCIGSTTFNEAIKHTNRLVQANKPTIENVIVQAVKYYNS